MSMPPPVPDPSASVVPPTVSADGTSPPATVPGVTPPIRPDAKLQERTDAQNTSNTFERAATFIIDGAEEYARRLSAALNEQPSDSVDGDPQTVHEMLHFSKYGTDAPSVFWKTHDAILQQAIAANDPDPYAAAERGALDEVYPYRAKLALLDVLGPDEKVDRANELMRISQRQDEKGHTPDRMPFLVGPAGLPHADAVMPGQAVQPRGTANEVPKQEQPKGGAY
jgi:hypothetical protein